MSVPDPAVTDWVPIYAGAPAFEYLGDYVPATQYNDGDIVMYNGTPWLAVKATTTPPDPFPMAGGAQLTYEGAHVPATTYDDGDVVVKDGVAYMCVGGPTTVAPDPAPWGQVRVPVVGDELAYVEGTSSPMMNTGVTTEAAASSVLAAPAVTVDGVTPIIVEIYFPYFSTVGTVQMNTWLYDGAASLGQIANSWAMGSGAGQPVYVRRRLIPSAGAHTYSARVSCGAGGGSVTVQGGPGTPGTYNPAFIRVSRCLPVPPMVTAGTPTAVTYGTSLPASPADGQEAILVDSLTAPTYQWRFRYNAGSTNADKWEFVGGATAYNGVQEGGTAETTAATTYTALTTPGPILTIPRAGVYDIETGFSHANSGVHSYMSYDIGATPAIDADAVQAQNTATSIPYNSVSRCQRKIGLSAAVVLTAKYHISAAGQTGYFTKRWMKITPVRVS